MINYKELFQYWISEREAIRIKKEQEHLKPWSNDLVFQTTYFCNVNRENDKVTKWIRENWTPQKLGLDTYEYAMVLARFLNWPPTLDCLTDHNGDVCILPEQVESTITNLAKLGFKVWGNAYVITSHGMRMPKATYLCQHLLPDVYRALPALKAAGAVGTCAAMAGALQRITGIGSFLAGQIVADLKNTVGHPLYAAPDKFSFVVPGPGSIRGLAWYHYGNANQMSERTFQVHFDKLRDEVNGWGRFAYNGEVEIEFCQIDSQDLQNCLCEFDKYCRVKFGTGRSKRQYQGV
jgi:hypothetical protein